jgi:hypothetical protein
MYANSTVTIRRAIEKPLSSPIQNHEGNHGWRGGKGRNQHPNKIPQRFYLGDPMGNRSSSVSKRSYIQGCCGFLNMDWYIRS